MPTILAAALAALASYSSTVSAADAAPPLPSTAQAWRAAALRDVDAGYRVTLANHAGAHDPHNPAFLRNLRAARAHGAALAAKVNDGSGYIAALLGFSNRIHDGHAGVYPSFDFDAVKPAEWPGFVAAWRGDLFVYASEDGAAREGERIVSCDGKPARRLLAQNVFAFLGRPKEEGQWWSQARNLFTDFGNPFAPRPQRCVFELDGRQVERVLAWRTIPDSRTPLLRDSVAGATLPVGLSEPRKNLFWVAMPTFQPSDKERAAYRAINEQVRKERERFLGADAVVVDLRRNQGGSSSWSEEFAKALWGDAELKRRDDARNRKVEVWYRASPGNIAYYQQGKEKDIARGETASAQWWAEREAAMRKAQAAGKPYYISKDEQNEGSGTVQQAPAAPFTRPVYVIVPGNCASACLDAIDYFKLFPNTKLVGAPSSADSTYMEVRVEPLPGGLARVIVPTKLYVNRPRGNGEFYRPDIPVTDLRWSTATFLEVVERDLAGK
ncbi:hypothetical protein LK542_08960 [Massilia sp. IC2-477]|uniref:S41 family peptidase n=1 Tax=Massilia sp. IC2-477 TaxID=2887198 RepID=UPI001D10DDA5|nr:S41 family peptidase [Massilia sp. IC2-477]MCC2955743.1 hypothetical protein [Massilia sp. IC2-477]